MCNKMKNTCCSQQKYFGNWIFERYQIKLADGLSALKKKQKTFQSGGKKGDREPCSLFLNQFNVCSHAI